MAEIRGTVIIFDHFLILLRLFLWEGSGGVRRRKGLDPERPLAGDFFRNIPLSASL